MKCSISMLKFGKIKVTIYILIKTACHLHKAVVQTEMGKLIKLGVNEII